MNNTKLPFLMCVTLGDYSYDGHSRTDKCLLRSNYSAEDVAKAYCLAVEKTGIDFAARVASEFEDKTYPMQEFKALGCPEDLLTEDETDDWSYGKVQDNDHYLALFGWFCSLAEPDLILEGCEQEVPDLVSVVQKASGRSSHMGYGLYYL